MQSSRNIILNRIRANKPQRADAPLPNYIHFNSIFDDATAKFTEVLRSIGGEVVGVESMVFLKKDYQNRFKAFKNVVCRVENLNLGVEEVGLVNDGHQFADVQVAILRGQFGVAENGSIWVTDTEIGQHRVLPFITQHLVLVLEQNKIFKNLHEAYKDLTIDETGFGVFIAGPSKTADIEQSLVIGAHGARSLVVYLV
ncbi:MAG: LUD domain-containing protein [Saprospiraceae bacterium]|nr:LUD domain-containing protein [Saprospiraceae bacterium]